MQITRDALPLLGRQRELAPDAQHFMAARAGAATVDASHAVVLSRPAAVGDQIVDVAIATRA